MAWTRKKLINKMKEEGWESMGKGVYRHTETGYKFEMFKGVKLNIKINDENWEFTGEQWRAYAQTETTPPPF